MYKINYDPDLDDTDNIDNLDYVQRFMMLKFIVWKKEKILARVAKIVQDAAIILKYKVSGSVFCTCYSISVSFNNITNRIWEIILDS